MPRSRTASRRTSSAGTAELIGELERLLAQQPLRERPRAQLMLALYRSGRQAEALEAYRAARRTLTEELGIEPGRALKELETRILEQDRPSRDRRPFPSTRPGRRSPLRRLQRLRRPNRS